MAKQPETDQDQAVKQEVKTEKSAVKANAKVVNIPEQHKPWLYATGAVLIVLIVFALGMSVANSHEKSAMTFSTRGPIGAGSAEIGGRMGGERHFAFNGGDSTNTSGQTRLIGVVTAVNGDKLTVAGGGTTTQGTTNSSTDYVNGSAVKANDSVIIMGTKSGDTVTATRIVINPESRL
jgi:hypothetical protein